MRRLFWLGVGIAAGVAISRKASQTARQATPAGLAGNLGEAISELAGAIGTFGADVRAGMIEREHELADAVEQQTGINPGIRHALRTANDALADNTPRAVRRGYQTAGARARRAGG